MGIKCEVNEDLNTRGNDEILWEIKCEVNEELNTRGNEEIRWESGVR